VRSCVVGQSGMDGVERCGPLIVGYRVECGAAWSGASEVVDGLVGVNSDGEGQCHGLELRSAYPAECRVVATLPASDCANMPRPLAPASDRLP
jgi:hypothetical protein